MDYIISFLCLKKFVIEYRVNIPLELLKFFKRGKMTENIKEDLLYWAKRTYNARMVPGTSGNISVKENNKIYLSKSGVCLFDMKEDEISELDLEGNLLNGVKPSSEGKMHFKIYKKRPDINAIIHIHCPYVTSFAVCKKEMNEPILPEFIYNFNTIPSAKYACPGSDDLADETSKYFEDGHDAVLMQNHGLVAGAATLKETFYILESIQAYAKTYFAAKFLGEIKTLNEEEVLKIKNLKG